VLRIGYVTGIAVPEGLLEGAPPPGLAYGGWRGP
jgi:hypothetical protein